MTCLKCGRETDQTFCEGCREVMKAYPVKPNTIILLPKDRRSTMRRMAPRRNTVSVEVQINSLKKTIQRLAITVAVLVMLCGIMGLALFQLIRGENVRPLGQNYSTVTRPVEDETQPATEPTAIPD